MGERNSRKQNIHPKDCRLLYAYTNLLIITSESLKTKSGAKMASNSLPSIFEHGKENEKLSVYDVGESSGWNQPFWSGMAYGTPVDVAQFEMDVAHTVTARGIAENMTQENLLSAKQWFAGKGCNSTLYSFGYPTENGHIHDGALCLHIPNGIAAFGMTADEFHSEQLSLTTDTKALFHGKVKNKLARSNLYYSSQSQNPDYENGKGTVIAYESVPFLKKVMDTLPELLDDTAQNGNVELTRYLVTRAKRSGIREFRQGIGFHGDSGVCMISTGCPIPFIAQRFFKYRPEGKSMFRIIKGHGDILLGTAKFFGSDWKKSSLHTVRHAEGGDKYTTWKDKGQGMKKKVLKRKRVEEEAKE